MLGIHGTVVRLQTCGIALVSLKGNQDVCGLDIMFVCNLLNDLTGQQRGVVGSKRGVSGKYDALLIAKVNDILLRA